MLNMEGYRYKDSTRTVVLFSSDDVRRITANWVEYGGGFLRGKANYRRAKDVTPETVILDPDKAIFDVSLCYRVGEVRQQRTKDIKRRPDNAVRLDASIYPLSKLVYCAHCELDAESAEDSGVRSYLTGKTGNKVEARRYRHDTERRCSAVRRSVNADLLERDFLMLLKHLTVNPESLPLLAKALEHFNQQNQQEDDTATAQAEMAHWRQRAKNADILFLRARISEDEWRSMLEEAEHEIARLHSQVAQRHEAEYALKVTMEMVANLVTTWNEADKEIRRGLANSLFEYIVYDLDKQQISDFKLTPWAELLMQLKVTLNPNDPNGNHSDGETAILSMDTDGKQRVLWCTQRDTGAYHVTPRPLRLATSFGSIGQRNQPHARQRAA